MMNGYPQNTCYHKCYRSFFYICIPKLKNISEDGQVGKMELEVIAEDAYFQPYEETFKVETSKKATVEVLNKKSLPKLILSIILMATVANVISKWIKKYKWISWLGLLAILVVAIEVIYSDVKIFL